MIPRPDRLKKKKAFTPYYAPKGKAEKRALQKIVFPYKTFESFSIIIYLPQYSHFVKKHNIHIMDLIVI
jgi:hypothetical protein